MAINIPEYFNNNLREIIVRFEKYFLGLNQEAHQLTSTTKENRYPEVFFAVKEELKSRKVNPRKVMSFGCSTGEECLTLQEYFPNSKIIGVDINKKNLRKCQRKIRHENFRFIYSDPQLIQNEAPLDIIFCMSVLCRWEETELVTNCDKIYPFAKFEQQVELMDRILDPGGLLIIYNSNFRFSDSRIYSRFQPICIDVLRDSGFVHKFNKRNQKIFDDYHECIFRKLHGPNASEQIHNKDSECQNNN